MKIENIIIIDDEPDICRLLQNTIVKFNYKVFCYHTLQAGLSEIAEIKPLFVFLDINLPDGNGLDAIAPIKKLNPATRVIMISAYDGKSERNMALSNGAEDFISKPFSSAVITGKLTAQNTLSKGSGKGTS